MTKHLEQRHRVQHNCEINFISLWLGLALFLPLSGIRIAISVRVSRVHFYRIFRYFFSPLSCQQQNGRVECRWVAMSFTDAALDALYERIQSRRIDNFSQEI